LEHRAGRGPAGMAGKLEVGVGGQGRFLARRRLGRPITRRTCPARKPGPDGFRARPGQHEDGTCDPPGIRPGGCPLMASVRGFRWAGAIVVGGTGSGPRLTGSRSSKNDKLHPTGHRLTGPRGQLVAENAARLGRHSQARKPDLAGHPKPLLACYVEPPFGRLTSRRLRRPILRLPAEAFLSCFCDAVIAAGADGPPSRASQGGLANYFDKTHGIRFRPERSPTTGNPGPLPAFGTPTNDRPSSASTTNFSDPSDPKPLAQTSSN